MSYVACPSSAIFRKLYHIIKSRANLMSKRRQNFQTISWFRDLYNRNLLDLDPKYQRRSVWSQEFKDYFIDTILLGYPSPAIFLYEEIDPNGVSSYSVVDGKQRLTTIFEFVRDIFPVSDKAERLNLQRKYFSQFDDPDKVDLWNYQFSVEYIPTKEDSYKPAHLSVS
jgi:uncharacterized protein with ParB-like and HNH nuclease domain